MKKPKFKPLSRYSSRERALVKITNSSGRKGVRVITRKRKSK